MKRERGFTLIELMIVVMVIAILAAVAITAYTKEIRKSRRAEARQALSDFSLRQEKYRSYNTTYGTCGQISGTDPLDPAGTNCATYNNVLKHYTVDVTANSATGYTLTATPKTGTDQTKDVCGTFTFTMASGLLTKSSSNAGDPACNL